MTDEERLTAITAQVLQIDESILAPELTLDELAVDSLDFLELITAIEAEFDIELDEDKLAACENLGAMSAMIMEQI